jgi:TetR/AcrR family tetracycline transcriptional repressor
VANEKLSRAAVVERAAKLADAEGVDAVTIRRLAQELGVTPMALYWHFKNKEELLLGLADGILARITPAEEAGQSWQRQLRAMVESVVRLMRAHPSLPDLLQIVDKQQTESFTRATNEALRLLSMAGFTLEEGYWVASYLLQSAIGLVEAQPGCPSTMTPEQGAEWRRQRRLELEALSPQEYPMMVRYAATMRDEPDLERYYAFGLDLMLAAVEAMAAKKA